MMHELHGGNGKPKRARSGLGLQVLVVEDDEQVASVLAALLESEGYEVAIAATAEAGLTRLQASRWHLLISDYWLPDKTGAWMLAEASKQGWMRDCRVLVVTAEHRPQGVENLRILRKPLDLDDFLKVVEEVLAPVREEELEKTMRDVEHGTKGESAAPKVELTLYISAASPSSLRAVRNLRRILAGYDPAQIRLTVCDLSREVVPAAEEDRVAFTPTLVKRSPSPKVWILGDLESTEVISDLLAHSGVDRPR